MHASLTERLRRVDSIFDAAIDLPLEDQTTYVARACGDDEALHAEVLELLREHHRSDSFLDSPAAQIAAPLLDAAAALAGPVPDRIGPFRVVREIGRGGMGRVFLAERVDGQFEQRVAVKVIQSGTPGVVKRFVEERRILALLAHPGIARLLDGGITSGGLPYFAMELVEGEPIDRYCDANNLSLDQRLDLFVKVCDAVSYAHQHLIIHRDLKPSNILVTAAGQVKLLDFGIAKVLDVHGSSPDLTRTEFSVMTPEFAAPEQVRGTSISTATDVYSLGVLLYMLLAGARPYDVRGKSPGEVERIVCREVPPEPSTQAPAAAARRLRGDLDLIVMTALQKAEDRRYQSPAALAQDLQRFRDGHAILARRDSRSYRLGKFVGRHRVGVAAGALVVVGLAGATSRERVLRNRAELAVRKASEVEGFLVNVFDVADPMGRHANGGSVTARELLDRGATRIDSTLAGQPEVQAQLRNVLGRVYNNLGLYDKAAPLLQRSLAQRTALGGPPDSSLAATMDLLGMSLVRQDKYAEAEPLLRGALEHRRRILGNAHGTTAQSLVHLATLLEERNEYNAAEPLYREALLIAQKAHGDSSSEAAEVMNDLGVLLHRNSKFEEAEQLLRRSLDIRVRRLGESHPLTAATLQNLAMTLSTRGKYPEAETFHRRALAVKRKVLGNAHPTVTISLNNLANLLTRQLGKLEEGEALVREALALDRQMFGENHSYVAESLRNLGIIMRMQGKFVEADSLLRKALAINRTIFTEPHERTATNLSAIALTQYAAGNGQAAIDYTRQSLAQYRTLLGEQHLNTIILTGSLGFTLAEYGDPKEAETLLRASQARLDSANGAHRNQFYANELALGKALLAQGRPDDALPILERAVAMGKKQYGEGNSRTGEGLLLYGKVLVAKGRYAEAEPLLRDAVTVLEKNKRGQPRLYARAVSALESFRANGR